MTILSDTVNATLREFWPIIVFYFPLGAIGIWRWGMWLTKKVIALGYRPTAAPFKASVSVITPVYNEDPDVFRAALESWHRNAPAEIIAVVDASDSACIEVFTAFAKKSSHYQLIVTEKPGKRPALADGVLAATSDIVALVDSDTIWAPTVLSQVTRPFRDPQVGGVGTRQNEIHPTTVAQKLFDIQLDLRYTEELPFLGASGNALTCLSGRTAVYRRAALLPILDEMLHETFWGKPVISGEDKRLTYLVLSRGWKLKYQKTAHVYTHGTETIRTFLQQRLRWTRNSWRADLRALTTRWIWKHPALAVFLLDRIIQPFVLLLGPAYLIAAIILGNWIPALVLVTWWFVTRAIRLLPHLMRRPQDILVLPHYILYTYITAIIRLYALFTLNTQGWITRWDASRLMRSSFLRKVPAYAATGATFGLLIMTAAWYQQELTQTLGATYYENVHAAAVHPGVRMIDGENDAAVQGIADALLSRDARDVVRAPYVVKRGDTYLGLAERYNVESLALMAENKNRFGGRLIAGTQIIIPLNATPATAESPSRPNRALFIRYVPATRTILVDGPNANVTLADIARVVGEEHLTRLADNDWDLKANLMIGRDVHLRLTASEVRTLRLASNAQGFVWLSVEGGRIIMDGVRVTSWDAARNDVDNDITDGRSYLLARTNGRMDILNSDLSYLGYALQEGERGGVYGVSWRIAEGAVGRHLMTGEVHNSRFHHNYFGAYTFGATGMIWQGNEFFENAVYGLDPHDDSNHFLVEGNRAYKNGKHGIIFSKRCFGNVIRENESFENGFHGIMLHEQSNGNVVVDNVASDNRDGIVVSGSSNNLVAGNTMRGNLQGIRVSDGATANRIENNAILQTAKHGIRLYADAHANGVYGNRITDSTNAITVETNENDLRKNSTRRTRYGVVLTHAASGNRIAENTFLSNLRSGILIDTDGTAENFFGENTIDRGMRSIAIR